VAVWHCVTVTAGEFIMSSQVNSREEEDIIAPLQRPPSPPLHTTFAARGLHVCTRISDEP